VVRLGGSKKGSAFGKVVHTRRSFKGFRGTRAFYSDVANTANTAEQESVQCHETRGRLGHTGGGMGFDKKAPNLPGLRPCELKLGVHGGAANGRPEASKQAVDWRTGAEL